MSGKQTDKEPLNVFILHLITTKVSSEIWKERLYSRKYLKCIQWNNILRTGREMEHWVAKEDESIFI